MTLALYKYDTLGRPLTKDEVDGNWASIEAAVNDALSGALPVSAITLVEDATGQYLRFLDGEGDALASIPFPAMLTESGDWESLIDYTTRHIVTHEGGTYLCRVAHTAGTFSTDLLSGKWTQLGSSAAQSIAFEPGATGLDAVTMQDAIEELAGMIGGSLEADGISYDNVASGMTATNVQAAIDQLAARPVVGEATEVAVDPSGSVTASDVQSALVELALRLDAVDEVSAADVSVTAITGVTGTDVQAVLQNLKTQIDAVEPGGGSGSAATTSFDPAGLGAVTTATNVQQAIADVVTAIGEADSGTVTTADVAYPGGAWGIGGTNLQTALVQIGNHIRTFDETLYEFPAAQVTLDLGVMNSYFDHDALPSALNKIAASLASISATLADHSSRLTALEGA